MENANSSHIARTSSKAPSSAHFRALRVPALDATRAIFPNSRAISRFVIGCIPAHLSQNWRSRAYVCSQARRQSRSKGGAHSPKSDPHCGVTLAGSLLHRGLMYPLARTPIISNPGGIAPPKRREPWRAWPFKMATENEPPGDRSPTAFAGCTKRSLGPSATSTPDPTTESAP
jgi:hypothetical protein